MAVTLAQYQEVMPTVFSIVPALTKTTIENKLSTIPAAPTPAPEPTPSAANVNNLFTEIYSTPTVAQAVAAAGGIRALASKHSMSRAVCMQLIQEFEAAHNLYNN